MTPAPTFSPAVTDVLLELVNIGVGRAARGLSELTSREVTMTVPTLEILDHTNVGGALDLCQGTTLRISQEFSGSFEGQALSSGSFEGHALLVLNHAGACRLAELLLGKVAGDDAFDENEQGALLELGNIIIGNVMGLLASELEAPVDYQLPELQLRGVSSYIDLISDLSDPNAARLIIMRASLSIKSDNISGYFILMLPEACLVSLIAKLTCLS